MKNSKAIFVLALTFLAAQVATAQYLHLLHEVQFPTVTNPYGVVGSSDCWGYEDSTGTDYAIIGNVNNIAFVRASDGAVIDQVVAPALSDPYYHRDIKTYGHYAYIVGECTGTNEGLTIVDLRYLPDSVHFVKAWTNNGTLVRSHNLDIDEGTGFLYIESDEFQGAHGVEIVDVNDPENPVKVGFINTPGVHDMVARNDTVWVAEGTTKAYSVWDCTDKGNPTLIGRVTSNTFGYCHNIWPSDDGKFFFTGEETPNKTVKVWDANDMQNIVMRGTYIAANQLVHNIHVEGKYLFMSHYTSGVRVVDWSDPDFPIEVAGYDTWPQNNNSNFYGCWGVYPHSENGYVYGSNFDGKLFIFEWLPNAVSIHEAQTLTESMVYPNPATEVANIKLELVGMEMVDLRVMDLQGKEVAVLFKGNLDAGTYTFPWRISNSLPAGQYLVRIQKGVHVTAEQVVVSR